MEKKRLRGILLILVLVSVLFLSYAYFSRTPSSPEERYYPADTLWMISTIDAVNGKVLSTEQLSTVESTFTGRTVVVVVFDEGEHPAGRDGQCTHPCGDGQGCM